MNAVARDRGLFVGAALVGAFTWWAFALGSPAFDAFDSPLYWTLGLALTAGACIALGYAGARSAWRWPCVVFGAQFLTGVLGRGGDPGNLWPIALALYGALAAGHLIPAYVGVGLRRLVEGRKAHRNSEAERTRAFVAGQDRP